MKHIKNSVAIPLIICLMCSGALAQPPTSTNYSLLGARIVTSGGKADSSSGYSAEKVTLGNFIGGEARSASYTLQAGLITLNIDGAPSIAIESIIWDIENPIQRGGVGYVKATIRNIGNITVDLSLKVNDNEEDKDKRWSAGANKGENDINRYLMSAVITSLDTPNVDFNENTNEDYLSESYQKCSNEKFAYSGSTENGLRIMPGKTRALHLKFEAPHVDTTGDYEHEEHSIYVELKAEKSKTN